ncbi:MAG: endonuclease [Bacteroidota bacterium]
MRLNSCLSFLCFLFLLTILSCEKEAVTPTTPESPIENPDIDEPPTGDFRVAFYNVENFFDTVDDPNNPKDDEFLPNAPKQWTPIRYEEKIRNIGKVARGMGYPELLGLAEVENAKVLTDLLNSARFETENYDFVHYNSPDFRGIDVALLYKKESFEVLESRAIEVELPAEVSEFPTTRDILEVRGRLFEEEVVVYVNHWPSRSGGVAATDGKRAYAASVLRAAIDEVLVSAPKANIILLGDFNDEPFDDSLVQALGVKTQKAGIEDQNAIYNCSVELTMNGEGSSFFRGDWQMLDQILVSGGLLDSEGTFKVIGYDTYDDESVLFDHPDDGLIPNRTYGGDNYFGGFSDHLAVYVEIENL